MARKMARRLPHSVSREDVESAALLGLTEAAERYDTSRREPFMAFAAKRVRGAILDHLRKSDVLTRRARQNARRVAEAARELEAELGRSATDDEVAASMGIDSESFHRRFDRVRDISLVHLDDVRFELPTTDHSARQIADEQVTKSTLVGALDSLDEREQMVLALYYREGLTLREIGTILGVTESRVCQIHTSAISAMREQLVADDANLN